jgi:eukaryotic-like serine/threonine-protein kinase
VQLTSGTHLGPYEVLSPLGAGGMGEVYRARDTRLDRSVAIKILPAEFAGNEQLRVRFEREARTISQLNHPNICTLHDVGRHEGNDFLVMELLEGETLADRLVRGALPLSEVLKIGVQIGDALDRAHRAGIIHRDLKPGNIMLTKTGAKLLDFGLAKSSGLGFSADAMTVQRPLTQEGSILGTFQYMAPEQLEGLEADARSDIFAFGAVLYEMTSGERAFDGSTKTSLIAAIVSKDPKPLALMQPLTPPALEHVVAKCLAKDADDRWQSAHDIAEELRWISEAGSQAGVAATISVRKKTRERLAWAAAAVLAIALAAFGVLYMRASQRATRLFVTDIAPPAGMRFNAVGDEAGALVLSPDGTLAVFSATDGTAPVLWLRSLITGETKPISGTEHATFPFWSPDGKKIGFFTVTTLKTVDITAGGPVTVLPNAEAAASTARGGAWGADGWILFTPYTQAPILRVRATGGKAEPVTTIDSTKHTSHRWPSFLPDGKHFIYLATNHENPTGGENGIYLSAVDSHDSKLIAPATSSAIYSDGYLLFVRNQTLFAQKMSTDGALSGDATAVAENVLDDNGIWRGAFSVSNDHLLTYHTGHASVASNLRLVDRSGKELSRLGDTDAYWDLELSRSGDKLAVIIGDPLRELWVDDLNRHTRTRVPIDGAWVGNAIFGADNMTLYALVSRKGRGELVSRRVSGGGETRLATVARTDLSLGGAFPDGKKLLGATNDGLVYVPLDPPGAAVPFSHEHTTATFPEGSRDGKWIAYMSDQNGRSEVFITSATDADQRWQVSSAGGAFPRWRADGKELFYLDLTNKLHAVAIEANGNELAIGTPQPLFSIVARPQCRPYAVTADGQHFIVNTVADTSSPTVTVVSNWMARLKR